MFSLLIGTIGGIAKSWLERKRVKAEGKIEVTKAKIEGKIKKEQTLAEAMAQQDLEAIKGASSTWRDEYWTIVLSIPAILCFIPGAVNWVRAGFQALATCPVWYQSCLVGAIAASFGIKSFIRWRNGK